MAKFYKTGISGLAGAPPTTISLAPESEKSFFLRQGEEGKFIIMAVSTDDIPYFYVHRYFSPQCKDRNAASMQVTCSVFDQTFTQASLCPLCNEMLFDKNVKRQLIYPMRVVNTAVREINGRKWGHTPCWVMLRKEYAINLDKKIREKSPDGKCMGMYFRVSRIKKQSPIHGDDFTYIKTLTEKELWDWCLRSPRIAWYQDKAKRETGRVLGADAAAKEYFYTFDPSVDFEPTQDAINYFMSFLARVRGNNERQVEQSPSWGSPLDEVQYPPSGVQDMAFGTVADYFESHIVEKELPS